MLGLWPGRSQDDWIYRTERKRTVTAGSTLREPLPVNNPLSAELSEMRRSLLPGLLAALRFNLNREADSFHAFEIGKVFGLRDGVPG